MIMAMLVGDCCMSVYIGTTNCNIRVGFPFSAFAVKIAVAVDVVGSIYTKGEQKQKAEEDCRRIGVMAMAKRKKERGKFSGVKKW